MMTTPKYFVMFSLKGNNIYPKFDKGRAKTPCLARKGQKK